MCDYVMCDEEWSSYFVSQAAFWFIFVIAVLENAIAFIDKVNF